MSVYNGIQPVGRLLGLVPCHVVRRLCSTDEERALVTIETDPPTTQQITLYLMGASQIAALAPGVRVGLHLEVYE